MRNGKSQRGIALLAMLAVFVMGGTYFMLRALNSQPAVAATRTAQTAESLNQAKQALVGYVAQRAALPTENNPGRLPCPEAAAFVGTASEGIAAGNCTLPAVGRLPWRTLGLNMLRDASGEPLWYVVSPGWALPTAGSLLTINSDTPGQLTVDGQANAALALIIAPGAPMNVQTAAGCTARIQARTAIPPDLRDYLECENATSPADVAFLTSGPMASFNDHVLSVTTGDLIPSLEAAIASRIKRDVAPALKAAYSSAQWGLSATNALFPYPATFTDPSASDYRGTAAGTLFSGAYQGLLPVTYSTDPATGTPCTLGPDPRCDPIFVRWLDPPAPTVTRTGGADLASYNCTVSTTTTSQIECTLNTFSSILTPNSSMDFRLVARADLVAMALRQLDTSVAMSGVDPAPRTASGVFDAAGDATVTLDARVPAGGGGLVADLICALTGAAAIDFDCYIHTISVPIALLADHPVINSSDPTYGWFTRNRWHQLIYYAVAQSHSADALPTPSCSSLPVVTCLKVTNVTPLNAQRSLLVLAGRDIQGAPRPNATPANYLEYGNNDLNDTFEQWPISTVIPANPTNRNPFNDRIVVIDEN